ncbi:ornithine cyclodeaminase family protein [Lutispora saccharofermentans]|uniref:Ornithine cyclodeaminase family protein n=1 Tax=Lutispora saccharofermentans TaxID=3024236 RepID=A0ABT1NDV5_9FIRM|nr:ornithine cyclodeaminase family protein [Lutispora saccharofermentans]MCQ1529437.1 ornithine cyclodeaminase family protein [Lutispora saccharofermentans]
MKKVELLYLSQEDILSLDIGWEEIIKRVEMAVSEQANDTIENPPKRGIHTRPDAFIHEMPVFLKKMDACGIKWVSGYPENYKHDLPQILGVQVMNCPETGVPTAVMDCRWITAVRTSAATAITAKYCAKKNSKKITIIGAGVQGRMHLLAIKHVLPSLEECHIVDIKENVLDDYVSKMSELSHVKIKKFTSIAEAVEDVDIIVTCTQKLHKPIIPADALKPGMLGAGLEAGRAWPAEIIHGVNKVITDDINQTSSYATTGAFAGGLPEFYCQLGDLVNGKPGRENDNESILAFNVGIAAEDISLGQYVYEKAVEKKIGTVLPLMETDF